MPNSSSSENVHGIMVERIEIFGMRAERQLSRYSEFQLLQQEEKIHLIIYHVYYITDGVIKFRSMSA